MSRADSAMRLQALVMSGRRPSVDEVRAEFESLAADGAEARIDRFAALLTYVWLLGPRPALLAPRSEWLEWFGLVGYVYHGVRSPAHRPRSAMTLYRAATREHAGAAPGSWTPALAYAQRFQAEHRAVGEDSRVWRALVAPRQMLAYVAHSPAEVEIVVALPDGAELEEVVAERPSPATFATFGRFGAAGLLVHDRGRVLLQKRGPNVQMPGTWSIPGGALERGEHPFEGALREAHEEAGIREDDLHLRDVHTATPAPGWRYTTIVADAAESARDRLPRRTNRAEVDRHEWVAIDAVDELTLHPGFAASWSALRHLLPQPTRVVFVCSGNICRSPSAELMFARMASDAGVAVAVRSRGTHAKPGEEIDPGTAAVLRRAGLDPSAHRAAQFTGADALWADVVVALDPVVEREIRLCVPGYERIRTHTVVNPWRCSPSMYELAHRQLGAVCRQVLDSIQQSTLERTIS